MALRASAAVMGLALYLAGCAAVMAVLPTRHGGKVGLVFAVVAIWVAAVARGGVQ